MSSEHMRKNWMTSRSFAVKNGYAPYANWSFVNVLNVLLTQELKDKLLTSIKNNYTINETANIAGRLVTKRGGVLVLFHLQDREGQPNLRS